MTGEMLFFCYRRGSWWREKRGETAELSFYESEMVTMMSHHLMYLPPIHSPPIRSLALDD